MIYRQNFQDGGPHVYRYNHTELLEIRYRTALGYLTPFIEKEYHRKSHRPRGCSGGARHRASKKSNLPSDVDNKCQMCINTHNIPTKTKIQTHETRFINNQLSIIVANCNSIKGKKATIEHMLDSLKPDVFIGIETKLNKDIYNNEFMPETYNIHRLDRTCNGGGVLIATKQEIKCKSIPNKTKCEIVWSEIETQTGKSAIIGAFYRPPNSSIETLDLLHDEINDIKSKYKNTPVMIGGDFNLPHINWNTHSHITGKPMKNHSEKLLDNMLEANLEQVNNLPTRKDNILELFFTSNPELIQTCETIPGISDHDHMLHIRANLKIKLNPKKARKIHLFKKADWNKIRTYLKEEWDIRFYNHFPNENTDTNWSIFKQVILDAIDLFIPSKQISAKYRPPWLTSEINKMIRKKQRCYNRAKNTNLEKDWTIFRETRKCIQKALKTAHDNYTNKILTEDGDTKALWRYLKGLKKDTCGIGTLTKNGISATTPSDKAKLLNAQFSSVFTKENYKNIPSPAKRVSPNMTQIKVAPEGVKKLLTNLKTKKAMGPDFLPAIVLKECATEISHPLALIIQQSLDTSIVPNDWKEALITPIFKKGTRSDPANYRPVSLTSICCKIAEHIIVSQTMSHLDKFNLLSPNQHGFRSRVSCDTQLLITIHDFAEILNRKSQVDIAVLDFEKAFDKVAHHRLIKKLYSFNINYKVINWIQNFLKKRTQTVVVDGFSSGKESVTSGVPQGTVLGPMLFLIFIDDIVNNLNGTIRLFADDCLIYREITSEKDTDELQNDLNTLIKWSNKWQMKFNIKKCNIMTLTNAKEHKIYRQYKMENEPLQRTDNIDYLGIKISTNLTWTNHIDNISNKARKTLGFLRRSLSHTNANLRNYAYRTLIIPKLEYASAIWDPYHKNQINKIEKIQKCAARFVLQKHHFKSPNQESTTKMIQDLGWESLEQRRKHSRLMLLYKLINEVVNIPAKYHPPKLSTGHTTRKCGNNFVLYNTTVNSFKYSFLPRTIKDWNALPDSAKTANSILTFKKILKTTKWT